MIESERDWTGGPAPVVDGADGTGFVLHVPFEASDLRTAIALAELAVRSLSGLPQVATGDAKVSREGQQTRHFGVLCDHVLLGRLRCDLRAGHDGDHTAITTEIV